MCGQHVALTEARSDHAIYWPVISMATS